ncbi:hypothetical protein ACOI1H_09040 [Loktanella sp. DJP18]|uniref:hypothetical protein n=1 Tax=Loktanella sp. DJP18 TaxID=3409788 RepID=UPI003BB65AF4
MNRFCFVATVALAMPSAAFAQAAAGSADDAFARATEANVCEFGVKSASYMTASQITTICLTESEAVTGFVPLLGGFAPALFPALAVLVGVAGSGAATDATSTTTSN